MERIARQTKAERLRPSRKQYVLAVDRPSKSGAIAIEPTRAHAKPKAAAPQRESITDFLARGGRVDVLPMGAVSTPFKYIGQPLAMG